MSRTFLQSNSQTADLTVYTFAGENFGVVSADRYIAVVIVSRVAGVGTVEVDAVTIGGVAATVVRQRASQNVNTDIAAIALAPVPAGTSGSVVVTFNGTMIRCGIALWSLTNLLSATPHDSKDSVATDPSVSLVIPADGCAIGVGCFGASSTSAWTGLTEDFDIAIEGALNFTGASADFTLGNAGLTVSVNSGSGINPVGVFASWAFGAAPGAPFVGIRPRVFIEPELDGYAMGWTDIASHSYGPDGLSMSLGINGTGPEDLVAGPGRATFSLRNDTSVGARGLYSLHHANKRAGWDVGIRCRIRLQDPATGYYLTRFFGRVASIDPIPGSTGPQRVRVELVSWMDEALRFKVPPSLGSDLSFVNRDDLLVQEIMNAMPRQPASFWMNAKGQEIYPHVFDASSSTRESALSMFAKIAKSGRSLIYETAAGALTLKPRSIRLLTTAVDWVIPESSIVASDGALNAESRVDDIFNAVTVVTNPRRPVDSIVVYRHPEPILVPAATTVKVKGQFRDPATGALIGASNLQRYVPGAFLSGAGEDFVAWQTQDGGGADRTGNMAIQAVANGSAVEFTLSHNVVGEGVWVTLLKLEGTGLYNTGAVEHEERDQASIDAYGERALVLNLPLQSDVYVAKEVGRFELETRKAPIEHAKQITILGVTRALVTEMCLSDINYRFTISEAMTGVSADFFVNHMDQRITDKGLLETTYLLAPALDPFGGGPYWLVGTAGNGELGTNTSLGY